MKPAFRENLRCAHQHLRSWLVDIALPYWAARGIDWAAGGFYERIDRHGRVIDDPRRTRLIARQIYVFAQAHRFGWLDNAESIVDHGSDFFKTRCLAGDYTVRIAVAADGAILHEGFELYDHAFALFALAEVAQSAPTIRTQLA